MHSMQALVAAPLFTNIGAIVRASAQACTARQGTQVHLIVALDASVSMQTSFAKAKEAVSCFFDEAVALTSQLFASKTLYLFADDTVKQSLDGMDVEAMKACIQNSKTRKGTNFKKVLSSIRKQVQEQRKGQKFFVVFFTDGQV